MVSAPVTNTKKRARQRRQESNFASEASSLIDGVCCSSAFNTSFPFTITGFCRFNNPTGVPAFAGRMVIVI